MFTLLLPIIIIIIIIIIMFLYPLCSKDSEG